MFNSFIYFHGLKPLFLGPFSSFVFKAVLPFVKKMEKIFSKHISDRGFASIL